MVAVFSVVLVPAVSLLVLVFDAAWPAGDRQEKVLHSVILNLLRIRDSSQAERIRVAFEEHSFGLLPMIKAGLVEVRRAKSGEGSLHHYIADLFFCMSLFKCSSPTRGNTAAAQKVSESVCGGYSYCL